MDAVEEYIADFPEYAGVRLRELRELIKRAVPDAEESIKWGRPAYSTGTVLVTFAGFTRHLNLYLTPSTITEFTGELSDYNVGKSAIQFPYGQPLPKRLLGRLLDYRVFEYQEYGINWMGAGKRP